MKEKGKEEIKERRKERCKKGRKLKKEERDNKQMNEGAS